MYKIYYSRDNPEKYFMLQSGEWKYENRIYT